MLCVAAASCRNAPSCGRRRRNGEKGDEREPRSSLERPGSAGGGIGKIDDDAICGYYRTGRPEAAAGAVARRGPREPCAAFQRRSRRGHAAAGRGLCAVPQLPPSPRRRFVRRMPRLPPDRGARTPRPASGVPREQTGQEVGRGGAQRRVPAPIPRSVRRAAGMVLASGLVRPTRSGQDPAGHDYGARGGRDRPQALVQALRSRLQDDARLAARDDERGGGQQDPQDPRRAVGADALPAGFGASGPAAAHDPVAHAGGRRAASRARRAGAGRRRAGRRRSAAGPHARASRLGRPAGAGASARRRGRRWPQGAFRLVLFADASEL